MTLAELLARQLEGTRQWTMLLLADLAGDDWLFQPQRGLAHPLWLCGHLACSQNTLVHVRCRDHGILNEEFCAHFPIGGPVRSASDHDYPAVDAVLETMKRVHRQTCDVVRTMTDGFLAEAAWGKGGTPHPHYSDKAGAVSHCSRHEAFHAGQVAMIRRLLGKPFLR